MSNIWTKLTQFQTKVETLLTQHATLIDEPEMENFNRPEEGWINLVWQNQSIRRAHLDVVDARQKRGLWMMHLCIFPSLDNNSPIFGFDVIAGANKITGAFLDLSPSSGGEDHPLSVDFEYLSKEYVPSKERQLPEWALRIFSTDMIAAGNVQTELEVDNILNLTLNVLTTYLNSIAQYQGFAPREISQAYQDFYCENQRLNPHTPKVMKSLGLDETDIDIFCSKILFPSIAS